MTVPRLFMDEPLMAGGEVVLGLDRTHYLGRVLRLGAGDGLRLFNARDGEWAAVLRTMDRRTATVRLVELVRAPALEPGPVLVFAPIRPNRMDWLVEKSVELGAAALVPVLTHHTVVRIDKADRLRAIAVEAAEQCGRLSVPPIHAPTRLAAWLAERDRGRPLLFGEPGGPPLRAVAPCSLDPDILIGPEGGLEAAERAAIVAAGAIEFSLGQRILRAETAALAALAAWVAVAAQRVPAGAAAKSCDNVSNS